ncbi:MAG: NAD-dependent epimerase/dehydratase family protein [Burkholderiales bacterium]|nr:NAD-dependent epimerase/dehydratase family protein [Bacteroidia bacterium]
MNAIIKEDINTIINQFENWDRFKNKTILISGANGFLPAYLVETLIELDNRYAMNIKVIALVRNYEKAKIRFSHHIENKHLQFIVQDVCDPIAIDKKIDFIIHAASQASPKYYGVDPVGTLSPNVIGTINLAKLGIENNVESFLYFSSSEVYGELPESLMPVKEGVFGFIDPARVRSCYGESKRMGETICVSYHHQFGLKSKIVRPFHTYGPGMMLDDGRVYADFISNLISNKDIVLNSDGSARRAFCYLTDATVGFFKVLLDGKTGEAYNIGNPHEEYSISELAQLVINLKPGLKVIVKIPETTGQYLKSTVSKNSPNIDKMIDLSWEPSVSAKIGFERTFKSFN